MRNQHIYTFTTYFTHIFPRPSLRMGLKTWINCLAKYTLFTHFKPSFQYLSYWNEPFIICGLDQQVLAKMSISIFRQNLTPKINSKYFGTDECVRIGETTVWNYQSTIMNKQHHVKWFLTACVNTADCTLISVFPICFKTIMTLETTVSP